MIALKNFAFRPRPRREKPRPDPVLGTIYVAPAARSYLIAAFGIKEWTRIVVMLLVMQRDGIARRGAPIVSRHVFNIAQGTLRLNVYTQTEPTLMTGIYPTGLGLGPE